MKSTFLERPIFLLLYYYHAFLITHKSSPVRLIQNAVSQDTLFPSTLIPCTDPHSSASPYTCLCTLWLSGIQSPFLRVKHIARTRFFLLSVVMLLIAVTLNITLSPRNDSTDESGLDDLHSRKHRQVSAHLL